MQPNHCVNTGKRFKHAVWPALLVVLCGCATEGPVAPLVPLPDSQMPTPQQLAYRQWRVVVADISGSYPAPEQTFSAELKNQLAKYGIQTVSGDARINRLMENMLKLQLQGGGDVNVKDIQYEMSTADGIISASIGSVVVEKNNELATWKDKKDQVKRSYTSQVRVSGQVTIARPHTGTARTVQFSRSESTTSYDQPHQFSVEALAIAAARAEARGSRVMEPLYTEFPLMGYVIGTGDQASYIRINRGAAQGVRVDRIWDLIIESRESNVLVGDIVTQKLIGTARTVEVSPDSCVARCDSSRTRERAKLGMKARAKGFGFSLASFLGGL